MENACECKAPRHSNKTSMIKIINKFIDKEEYGDVQHIWRLQLFNNFCMSQIFGTLLFESQSIINNFTVSCVMKRDYFNLCDKFGLDFFRYVYLYNLYNLCIICIIFV